ncbi:MAG: hypothetical protein JNN11_01125 [Candidatus Doudnabacteria bacterium]|nr:hypothetical protein [Candidatus Doudnabacteria bacterium]
MLIGLIIPLPSHTLLLGEGGCFRQTKDSLKKVPKTGFGTKNSAKEQSRLFYILSGRKTKINILTFPPEQFSICYFSIGRILVSPQRFPLLALKTMLKGGCIGYAPPSALVFFSAYRAETLL